MSNENVAPKPNIAYNRGVAVPQYVNVQYKDRVFRDLFGNDKEAMLSLYNAVNGTSYTDANAIKVITLNDAIYAKMKNDMAFLFSNEMNLYEHQSTYNPNMPLRGLLYFAEECEKRYWKDSRGIYGRKLIKIAAPRYIVFYNGTDEMPDHKELKLSEAFEVPSEGYEWTAHMLNINAGRNTELVAKCEKLSGYVTLVSRIREYQKGGMDMANAVSNAVDDCIRDGILEDYLSQNRERTISSFLCEYDEAATMDYIREEGHEEGFVEGEESGSMKRLISSIQAIMDNLKLSLQEAMDALNVSATDREMCLKELGKR